MNYIDGNNILIKLWTPLSLLVQGGIVAGLLRLAGLALNPVKNTKKRERAYERANMKKVGVMQQPNIPMPVAPVQGQENPQDGMTEEMQVQPQAVAEPQVEMQPQVVAEPQAEVQPQAVTEPQMAVQPQAATEPVVQEQVFNSNGVQ